jgi:protein TonB
LHAALLWQPRQDQVPVLNIGGEARALRVTLDAGSPAAADLAALEIAAAGKVPLTASRPTHVSTASTKQRFPETAAPTAPHSAPAMARQPEAVPFPGKTRGEQRITAAATEDASPQPSSLSVGERVSAALQSQLAEAFDYPWLARKRGWQGLVTLSLHVAEDGALSRWKVVRTSGYSLLDRSALQAAQRIGRLQRAEQLLDGRSLNLSIPVRYRLLDG